MLTYPHWMTAVRRLPGLGHRRSRKGRGAGLLTHPPGARWRSRQRQAVVGFVCAASLATAYASTAQASSAQASSALAGAGTGTVAASAQSSAQSSAPPIYLTTHYS